MEFDFRFGIGDNWRMGDGESGAESAVLKDGAVDRARRMVGFQFRIEGATGDLGGAIMDGLNGYVARGLPENRHAQTFGAIRSATSLVQGVCADIAKHPDQVGQFYREVAGDGGGGEICKSSKGFGWADER